MTDDNWEMRIKWAEDLDAGKDIWWLKKIRPKVYSEFKKRMLTQLCKLFKLLNKSVLKIIVFN